MSLGHAEGRPPAKVDGPGYTRRSTATVRRRSAYALLATFREQGRHDLAALLAWLLDDRAAA